MFFFFFFEKITLVSSNYAKNYARIINQGLARFPQVALINYSYLAAYHVLSNFFSLRTTFCIPEQFQDRRFPKIVRVLFEVHTNDSEHFFELFRRLTKFAEDFQVRCKDVSTFCSFLTERNPCNSTNFGPLRGYLNHTRTCAVKT